MRHQAFFFRFGLKDRGAGRIDDQFEESDVRRQEDERQMEEHRQQRHPGDRHVHGKDVSYGFLQVIEYSASQPDRADDRRKIVVQ